MQAGLISIQTGLSDLVGIMDQWFILSNCFVLGVWRGVPEQHTDIVKNVRNSAMKKDNGIYEAKLSDANDFNSSVCIARSRGTLYGHRACWQQQFYMAMLTQILAQYVKKMTAFYEIFHLGDWNFVPHNAQV